MSRTPAEKQPARFWRHVSWVYVVGLLVSTAAVILVSSYYDVYGLASVALWGPVIGTDFKESRRLERKRFAEGVARPRTRTSARLAEIAFAAALVLVTVALVVGVAALPFGDHARRPSAAVLALTGVAVPVSAVAIGLVLQWARRRSRARSQAETQARGLRLPWHRTACGP